MAVFASRNASWLQWIVPERFNDSDLFKIVTFFVFHSPCPELSSMGRSLSEYGWTAPWKKPYYLNRQLRQAATNYNLIYSANGYDAMESALEKAWLKDNFPSDYSSERISIYDNQSNQFLSVFYHLRNAFAHCWRLYIYFRRCSDQTRQRLAKGISTNDFAKKHTVKMDRYH